MKEINGAVVLLEVPPGLFFPSESSLEGFNGCQGFSAEWDTVPSSSMIMVDVGRIRMNRNGCRTVEQQEQRDDFMSVLAQEAIAYSISEDEQELTMYSVDIPTMTLMRIPRPIQPHERLIGTSWIATGIRGLHTRNTLRPVLKGNHITVSFSRDEVEGNAGCNQFSGDILSMTSTDFQVADMITSEIHCGQDAMAQERSFMRIIENPGLQYTLSYGRVGDEWTQVLELESPDSVPVMARFVPFVEDPDEEIEPSLAGSDEEADGEGYGYASSYEAPNPNVDEFVSIGNFVKEKFVDPCRECDDSSLSSKFT